MKTPLIVVMTAVVACLVCSQPGRAQQCSFPYGWNFGEVPIGNTVTECLWLFCCNGNGPCSPSTNTGPCTLTLDHSPGPPFNAYGYNILPGSRYTQNQFDCTGGTTVTSFPVSLAAGQDLAYTVSFSPTTSGSFSDSTSIQNQAGGRQFYLCGSTPGGPPASPSVLAFGASAYVASDTGGQKVIEVTRTESNGGAVTVDYATTDGTAKAGVDYTATRGTLNWSSGDSVAKSVSVAIRDRASVAARRTVNLALTNPTGSARLGTPSTAVLTIQPSDLTLWLDGKRFQVQATWTNQFDGSSGSGIAIPATDSTGFFYFTDPAVYELVVKILLLDAGVAVFYGELTDLQFTITVTDTQSGAIKAYQNTAGNCGGIDQNAFPTITALAAKKDGRVMAGSGTVGKVGSCAPSTDTLCLENRRFALKVNWMNQFDGSSGVGIGRNLSDQSGDFTFTDPTVLELVAKVVDLGNRTAFFWSALTDYEYDIGVTDTIGGSSKTYHNPAGMFCGGLDNAAFPP
jgi:hypothetical protein